jgi:hypothetical protein
MKEHVNTNALVAASLRRYADDVEAGAPAPMCITLFALSSDNALAEVADFVASANGEFTVEDNDTFDVVARHYGPLTVRLYTERGTVTEQREEIAPVWRTPSNDELVAKFAGMPR